MSRIDASRVRGEERVTEAQLSQLRATQPPQGGWTGASALLMATLWCPHGVAPRRPTPRVLAQLLRQTALARVWIAAIGRNAAPPPTDRKAVTVWRMASRYVSAAYLPPAEGARAVKLVHRAKVGIRGRPRHDGEAVLPWADHGRCVGGHDPGVEVGIGTDGAQVRADVHAKGPHPPGHHPWQPRHT